MALDRDAQTTLIITAVTVVTVAVAVVKEVRAERRLLRLRRLLTRRPLTRSEYWDVYSDVLADLGGGDAGAPRP